MIVPTLQELQAEIQADLEQALGITANFNKKVVAAFAAVQAAKIKTIYLSVASVQRNIFADTADSEVDGGTLERFGRAYLNRNPNPATQGVYNATVTGSPGGMVRAGTTFREPNTNFLYQVEQDLNLVGTTGTMSVRALTAGREAELFEGSDLVSTIPIANVSSNATVSAVTVEPENQETKEDYRAAILQSIRLEPQGGSAADYRIWASDAVNIKQVYPFAGAEAGILNLFAESNDATLIPSPAALAELETVILADPNTGKGRKPISAWQVNYLPVTTLDVDITVNGLNDNSASVITAITNAVTAYLLTIRPFVGGADDPNNIRDTLRIADVNEVISNTLADGNFFINTELYVDSNLVNSFRFTESNVPITGTITAP